ncbi:ornithine aminotransferase [Aureimonas sp. Leaf454]|uniref:BON domain-containing protein n=1 Tax=Aureimonas sp. Leaf454 TaxID=1736381 RepID=UPI0006FEE4C9|nr:BON domain-containing protein [Aureimonas sp. Leaf454]KQT50665.1 ornithine aminotransferase [Aureimonas sp. Leaf454]
MLDIKLRQTVMDALEFEPSIDCADIGVAVDNGIVTITGHVPTYAQKSTVERIVMRVKGVKGIAQEIEVRPTGSHRTADDEIARRAVSTLRWNTSVPVDAIQVKVEKGWVTLAGTVEWQYQKTAAFDAVRHLPGVVGVANLVQLSPSAQASDIKRRIEDALKRDAMIDASAIRVDVRQGEVTLAGHVKAWSERESAEWAAWSAPGVTHVEDHIRVAS